VGRLDEKVALVSGAARGQGAAIARRLACEGAIVYVTDVSDELGRSVADDLGGRGTYRHLDVTSASDWADAMEAVQVDRGRLDILVNNAGVNLSAALADTAPEEFLRVVQVNQVGTWLGVRSAVAPMRASGGGSIVNIGSIIAFAALPGKTAYASSKHAVRGITRCAAAELGVFGIRVNVVHPAGISTDMTAAAVPAAVEQLPIPRMGFPADTASAVLFFASDDSSYCTGTELSVDGGRLVSSLPL
jgi:3alpha(or 20beta)-hydroxysteroid dehydrogenase